MAICHALFNIYNLHYHYHYQYQVSRNCKAPRAIAVATACDALGFVTCVDQPCQHQIFFSDYFSDGYKKAQEICSFLGMLIGQDVAMAKDFVGKFANAGRLNEAADYTLLNEAVKECDAICLHAGKMKLEAMLLQAYKVESIKSRKELVQCQFQELAGSDGLSETDIQPVLLEWAKSILN